MDSPDGPQRRRRRAIGGLVGLALLAGLLVALPEGVRWATVSRLGNLTGEPVSIADVDLNLFTRRLTIEDVRIGKRPLARLERLEARFRLLPLLRGHLYLDEARLTGAVVHAVRAADGSLDLGPLLERLRRRPPAPRGLGFTLEHGHLEAGAAIVEDGPAPAWRLSDLTADVHSLSTAAARPPGRARATFGVNGAQVEITAEDVRLQPATGRARVVVDGLDLTPAAASGAAARFRLVSGRLSGTWIVRWSPDGLEVGGHARLEGLELTGGGGDGLRVSAPALILTPQNATYRDGVLTLQRLEIQGAPALALAGPDGPRRWMLPGLRAALTGLSYPARGPGHLVLVADLPGGGRLTAQGPVTFGPMDADLEITARALDVRLVASYLPARAPVSIARGTLGTTLRLRYRSGQPARVDGGLTLRDFALLRQGQREPFVIHRELRGRITGLAVGGGAVTLDRLTLSGAPTIVDASVQPPQRFDIPSLVLTVTGATWPSRGPAAVMGQARLTRGRARLEGRVDPGTLQVEARLTASEVDLTPLAAYVATAADLRVDRGQLDATVQLWHDRRSGVSLTAGGTLADLQMTRSGARLLRLEDRSVGFWLHEVRIHEGRLTADLTVRGSPILVDLSTDAARRLEVPALAVDVRGLRWPPDRLARWWVAATLPGQGRLTADGSLDLSAVAVGGAAEIADAALEPYQPFVPLTAPLAGRLDGRVTFRAEMAPAARAHLTGWLTARRIAIGDPERPPVAVSAVEITGLDVVWPERVAAERLLVREPRLLIERAADGDFPLLARLRPTDEERSASPAASPGHEHQGAPAPGGPVFGLREARVVDGDLRYLDRTTRPFYSEEVRRLNVSLKGLDSAAGRADLTVQGIVGPDAALDLRGVVAPFGRPFFLEVEGTLQRFAVPRTNPYLRRFLNWIARSGELTTRLHYRVVGEDLHGTNELLVERLQVERAPDSVGRALGLPLALLVSLLKNPRGDIHLTRPVEGQLGSPRFSFGDALLAAFRNVLAGLVTRPLRTIGRVFTGNEGVPTAVVVEPATFDAGRATITPEAARHLQRVADVLRAAPFVRLSLRAVVTDADRRALAREAGVAEIQRAQREAGLADFADAARDLFQRRRPGQPVPERVEDTVEGLAEATVAPEAEVHALAAQRADAVRRLLVEEAGLDSDRLVSAPPLTPAGGPPRVEFELAPAG